MHINPKQLLKRSSYLGISFLSLLYSTFSFAQAVPIGFYEGLMGNSGVAISDSMASSYYNPSLLIFKNKNSYSLGGNSFSNFNSDYNETKVNSSKISPSYLSSVQVFDSFVHEFYLTNTLSLDSQIVAPGSTGGEYQYNIRLDQYQMGYTFAFPSLPMGFQTSLRFKEAQTVGFYEFQDSVSSLTSNIQGSNRQIDFLISIGAAHQFGAYKFGYKYLSRGWAIYKKNEGLVKNFLYIPLTNQYSKSESPYNLEQPFTGETISFGHGFKINDHEFLTDSQFVETPDLTHTYDWSQTFGYKLSSISGYQYMCGLSHSIAKEIKYFGQNIYVSTGFSWLNKASRSAFGMYYYVNKLSSETRSYGLTFSSELTY